MSVCVRAFASCGSKEIGLLPSRLEAREPRGVAVLVDGFTCLCRGESDSRPGGALPE